MRIEGGMVLLASGGLQAADLSLPGGLIQVGGTGTGAAFDATGLLVLPGIVDLHCDAF